MVKHILWCHLFICFCSTRYFTRSWSSILAYTCVCSSPVDSFDIFSLLLIFLCRIILSPTPTDNECCGVSPHLVI